MPFTLKYQNNFSWNIIYMAFLRKKIIITVCKKKYWKNWSEDNSNNNFFLYLYSQEPSIHSQMPKMCIFCHIFFHVSATHEVRHLVLPSLLRSASSPPIMGCPLVNLRSMTIFYSYFFILNFVPLIFVDDARGYIIFSPVRWITWN